MRSEVATQPGVPNLSGLFEQIFTFSDHEDMDEYIPPPAVVVSGKENRGKSPVMPSYRKPPPYVSP